MKTLQTVFPCGSYSSSGLISEEDGRVRHEDDFYNPHEGHSGLTLPHGMAVMCFWWHSASQSLRTMSLTKHKDDSHIGMMDLMWFEYTVHGHGDTAEARLVEKRQVLQPKESATLSYLR